MDEIYHVLMKDDFLSSRMLYFLLFVLIHTLKYT